MPHSRMRCCIAVEARRHGHEGALTVKCRALASEACFPPLPLPPPPLSPSPFSSPPGLTDTIWDSFVSFQVRAILLGERLFRSRREFKLTWSFTGLGLRFLGIYLARRRPDSACGQRPECPHKHRAFYASSGPLRDFVYLLILCLANVLHAQNC